MSLVLYYIALILSIQVRILKLDISKSNADICLELDLSRKNKSSKANVVKEMGSI